MAEGGLETEYSLMMSAVTARGNGDMGNVLLGPPRKKIKFDEGFKGTEPAIIWAVESLADCRSR